MAAISKFTHCMTMHGKHFYAYLLGQVLSFSLIKQGIEPLHAPVLVSQGNGIGIMGDCGYGKSTLVAAFLRNGYRLLTDDMLVVREEGKGFMAFPGPPRIKLFSEVAQKLLGEGVTGTPIDNMTPKLIIPLGESGYSKTAVPLKALYVLRPPAKSKGQRVVRRKLNRRQAVIAIVANTFNAVVKGPYRLKQLFSFASQVAQAIPMKSLSYPGEFDRLPEVVEAVSNDLSEL
jgi:hypothetical protein